MKTNKKTTTRETMKPSMKNVDYQITNKIYSKVVIAERERNKVRFKRTIKGGRVCVEQVEEKC